MVSLEQLECVLLRVLASTFGTLNRTTDNLSLRDIPPCGQPLDSPGRQLIQGKRGATRHGCPDAAWEEARTLAVTDFEDAAVAMVAKTSGSAFIVSRNVDDFLRSPVPASSLSISSAAFRLETFKKPPRRDSESKDTGLPDTLVSQQPRQHCST